MTISSEHLSQEDLLVQIERAKEVVEIGAIYSHYRDLEGCYRVMGVAIIEATQEPGVIYQKEFGSDALKSIAWIRPLSSWIEKVKWGEVMVARFQKIQPS